MGQSRTDSTVWKLSFIVVADETATEQQCGFSRTVDPRSSATLLKMQTGR